MTAKSKILKSLITNGLVLGLFLGSVAQASPMRPSERHDAGPTKVSKYFSEGFFIGGERSVTSARLKDIRRANSKEGFERLVLDLEPSGENKKTLPHFQVQAAPGEGRLILSIWADVQYDFDSGRIKKSFAKSRHIKQLNVLPRIEEGLTIIEFVLKAQASGKKQKFEVFHLANPSRIIVDVI
jgi:hypothetical protein